MKGRVKTSIFRDLYQQPYSDLTRVKLYNSTKDSLDLVQRLRLTRKLPIHNGCVNSLCWNETGEYLLSGSDDQHLVVTHGYNYKVLSNYKTSHRANIFSAKFLPACGDTSIISCSGDGIILYTDLLRRENTHYNQFNCHSGTTYEVITVPNDPNSFLSCGEDGTVRWFDLRIKSKCTKPHCKEDIMITCPRAVTALSISPLVPYHLAIGCSDSTVRMFDRRMLTTKASGGPELGPAMKPMCSFTVPSFGDRSYRITSLCFSPEGDELLVSYSSDHLYLFNVKEEGFMKLSSESSSSNIMNQDKEKRSRSPPPVRRLRLRGDWSDTGPDARPEREGSTQGEVAQARPTLHATLMQRMTDVLTRMLNDPATRAALSGGGEDSLEREDINVNSPSQNNTSIPQSASLQPPQPSLPADGATTILTASPISVPQMSSLSINSSEREANLPDVCDNDPEIASTNASVSSSNVLDLRCVQCGAGSSDSECDQLGACSSVLPSSGECVCASSADSDMRTDPIGETGDDISEESEIHSTSYQPRMNFIQRKISSLQDKLSTLREGFIERHGSEPAVRLMYSEKSSTNATISLGVADEVSRNLHSDNRSSISTSGPAENDVAVVSTVPVDDQGISSEEQEPQPGPSTAQSSSGIGKQSNFTKERCFDTDDDDDDESDVNDYYMLTKNSNVFSENRSFVHPIEQHMEEAIKAARCEKKSLIEDNDEYQPLIKQKFTGHRNARTMIKEATFWGNNFVLSGSDCGHVFIWDRYTGSLVMLLEADRHVVNCLQPHPVLPLLATSGIDYDVKLWAPLHEEPCFDKDLADVLTKRNEVMLEETKDTITVPASFMIRMLACLNQIRRGGRNRTRNTRRQSSDDNSNN